MPTPLADKKGNIYSSSDFCQPGQEQRAVEMHVGNFWLPPCLLGLGWGLIQIAEAGRWLVGRDVCTDH